MDPFFFLAQRMIEPFLVIGVDFGTNFSGFSYALWEDNKALTTGSASNVIALLFYRL
jgi:hypothetical protein